MRRVFVLETWRGGARLKAMPQLIQVEPIAMLPTQAGCAAFLGDGNKTILIYIDPAVGAAINLALGGHQAARPLTHDLYQLTLQAFGAKILRAVIVDLVEEIFHARLILEAENEIMERKIIELDARPSDCIALTVRCGAPLYVEAGLWHRLKDMSAELASLRAAENEENA